MTTSLILLSITLLSIGSFGQAAPNYAFTNGQWFDGQSFRKVTFYAAHGELTTRKPSKIDRTVDLNGKYVIPPFGEAHNHNLERVEMITVYLSQGIFYVKVPNNLPRIRPPLAGKINVPTGVDAVFANGGLTGSGGHPAGHIRRNLARGVWTEADGEGAFLFTIANETDLESKWPQIKAGKPDFIKTYLLYSEEFEKRRDSEEFFSLRGLDPKLLPKIVKRAHRDGLRVSTHVETATDFHHAVAAGVDEVNHLPGFMGDPKYGLAAYEIREADSELAGKRGITVVTTISGVSALDPKGPQAEIRKMAEDLFRRNLQVLRKNGVKLAIGSDNFRATASIEAHYLSTLGIFDNLALLKMWSETTPAAIFPKRKIGRLQNGYEASFLVLSANPLDDFANVKKIEMRVKQGVILADPAVTQ